MNRNDRSCFLISISMLILISMNAFSQQNVPFIRVSPPAKVSQGISFATVEINYSRPGKKGREIWGELVPYGLAPNAYGNRKPKPWRAGANENTTIFLSHDAKINAQPLPAGTYGLHIIANEDEWTIIFSKDHNAWGSFFYEKENDALRIKVKPQKAPPREWMMFGFENLSENSADVFLHWAELKIFFTIEVDHHQIVIDTYREKLTFLPGFYPRAWRTAARYCMQNEVNLEEALIWIDKALSMDGGNTFAGKSVKAGLLTLLGKPDEGDKIMVSSIEQATENELNYYGYQLLDHNRLDEAIRVFQLNIERHPESWNVYDSLGEAYAIKGDIKRARENYEKAHEIAPDTEKERIKGLLEGFEK